MTHSARSTPAGNHALIIAAAACVFLLGTAPALAKYPERPITLVVPFAAGGGSDGTIRIIAEHMATTLGQPFVIENGGGAGGTTATARVARAAADGYTLILGNSGTHSATPAQYSDLKYNPAKDFTPIGLSAEFPMVVITRRDFPANSLREFVDYVRKNQNRINEAHSGVGSQSHSVCTLLQSIMGTRTARIAYRGTAPAMNDMIAGHVDFKCVGLGPVISFIQAGTIKVVAVASTRRVELIKDVPTTAEGGLPQFQVSGWNALFAPAKLPADIQLTLNEALGKALDDPAVRKRLLALGNEIPEQPNRSPEALQGLVEREIARWSSVLKPTAGP